MKMVLVKNKHTHGHLYKRYWKLEISFSVKSANAVSLTNLSISPSAICFFFLGSIMIKKASSSVSCLYSTESSNDI